MKRKLKILRIISSIDPKYGGPSKATIDSSITLIKQGFEIHILTTDLGGKKFSKSNKIKIIYKGPYILGDYRFSLKQFLFIIYLIKHLFSVDYSQYFLQILTI